MSHSLEESGEMAVVNTLTGELMAPAPQDLDDVVKRSTGGLAKAVKTSWDMGTVDGKMHLARAMNFQPTENQKQNEGWYGKAFNLIGYVCRGVLSTKNTDGTKRETPLVLVQTVLESDAGELVSSASDFVYASLMEICSLVGAPSAAKPIRVSIKKAGQADKLFMIFDSAASSGEHQSSDGGRKKK